MEVFETALPGVLVLTPARHGDHRGFFSEVYNRHALEEVGITDDFVQDNHSLSEKPGTVRGLHFQVPPEPVAKLVRVTKGSILDVVVDIRHGSPTFGEHVAVELSDDNWRQIYVPVGFAHGFCTLESATEVSYKVTGYWKADVDKGILWDDPNLGIAWPVETEKAIVSAKDASQPCLEEVPPYFVHETVA